MEKSFIGIIMRCIDSLCDTPKYQLKKRDIVRLQNMEGLLYMKKNHCKKNDVAGYAPIVVFAYNRAEVNL